jgi:hypothetical protein
MNWLAFAENLRLTKLRQNRGKTRPKLAFSMTKLNALL